jgi:hypothetical protein
LTYEWRARIDVQGGGVAVADLELDTQVLRANLYCDFGPAERFTPYIGIGAAVHSTSGGTVTLTCGGTCNFDGESKLTPAAALKERASILERVTYQDGVLSLRTG